MTIDARKKKKNYGIYSIEKWILLNVYNIIDLSSGISYDRERN